MNGANIVTMRECETKFMIPYEKAWNASPISDSERRREGVKRQSKALTRTESSKEPRE